MILHPATATDLQLLALRGVAEGPIDQHIHSDETARAMLDRADAAYSVLSGNRVLCTIGWVLCSDCGSTWGWALVAQNLEFKEVTVISRAVRRAMDVFQRERGVVALKAFVDMRLSTAVRWAEVLGFEFVELIGPGCCYDGCYGEYAGLFERRLRERWVQG